MKKKFFFLLIIPLIVILIFTCRKSENLISPSVMHLTESVYASGIITSKNEYKVFSLADGYITRKLVSEGDMVINDQALFEIENSAQNARYESSLQSFNVAKQNVDNNSPVLSELKTSLLTAEEKMKDDSINYFRYKSLLEKNAASRIETEKYELQYKVSSNNYHALIQKQTQIRNQLQSEYKNAQTQLSASTTDKNNYLVKSFSSGRILELYKEKGEAVRRNEVIGLIGDQKQMYLKLTIDETDIERIKIGQLIYVNTDSDTSKIYKAKITKIYPQKNYSDQTFRIDAEFTETYDGSFNGVFAEANIVIAEKNNALVIPKHLLLEGDSVLVRINSSDKKVKVTKGIEDFNFTEIISGLEKESKLINK